MKRSVFCMMTAMILIFSLSGCTSADEWEQAQAELAAAQNTIQEWQNQNDALLREISGLESSVAEKDLRIEELENKLLILTDENFAADDREAVLYDEIRQLRATAELRIAELQELQTLIDTYENITSVDFSAQAGRVSDLLFKVADSQRPTKTVTEETLDENQTVIQTETQVPGTVAFYYQDLTTGYTLSYNADEVMYAASLIKVPYVYALLRSVAEFEYDKLHYDSAGNPLYDADGNPLFEGTHPNLDENGNIVYAEGEEKYNLCRVWTYDAETMMETGSGIIQEEQTGFQLTYLELVRYALQYSDNIAFAQLRKMFGYSEYYAEAYRLGIQGVSSGFMKLTAVDCGKFLRAAYTFIEENDVYGSCMREALVHSNYGVMIPAGISSVVCAHKYGWDEDAYHDMAIVYDEHPYILVILTNLDQGGTDVNTYIQDIARSVHKIHRAFYPA